MPDFHLAGELDAWPTKQEMADLLRDAGLAVTAGEYSIRVDDCDHFVFQEYGGDLGAPHIEADGDTREGMLNDAGLVSAALSRAKIRHRFEIYDDKDSLVGYLHYNWPK